MPENNYTAGQPINLGFNRLTSGKKINTKSNGFFKNFWKWASIIGATSVMSWNVAGVVKDKLMSPILQNFSDGTYATQQSQISNSTAPIEMEEYVKSIFECTSNPLSKINFDNHLDPNTSITPNATELSQDIKDVEISSDATKCDLESRIYMYPYPINQEFIDSISEIDSGSKITKLYADIVMQFPRAYSAVFDAAKENGINLGLCAAFLTLEGGFQMAYNAGESDNEMEREVKNSLGYDIRGVWQITYDTWKQYGEGFSWDDMYKYGPSTVVFTRVLKHYMEIVGNDFTAGILAYNMGPNGVKKLIREELDGDSSKLLDFIYEMSLKKNGYGGKSQRYWKEKADYVRTIVQAAIFFQTLFEETGLNVPNALFSDKINWRYLGSVLANGNPETSNPKVPGNGIYEIYLVGPGDNMWNIKEKTGANEFLINGKKYDNTIIHPGDVILCIRN